MSASVLHWVFGYGSLIWQPGFSFVRRERALLRGAHRSLCIYSQHYRGTPEAPGLVFGLAQGGACGGMAFAVADTIWPETLQYLRDRELVTSVYREAVRPEGRAAFVVPRVGVQGSPVDRRVCGGWCCCVPRPGPRVPPTRGRAGGGRFITLSG